MIAGMSPIGLAVSRGSLGCIRLLVTSGARTDLSVPLAHIAVRNGRDDALRVLLDLGIDINAEVHMDFEHRWCEIHDRLSPLALAAVLGRDSAVDILLEANAEIDGSTVSECDLFSCCVCLVM